MNELIEKKQKWELLYDEIRLMNYGDIITHAEIEAIIEEEHNKGKYNSIISRARKELLVQGKEIESLHGQGYRVLQPGQYIDKSVSSFKAGFRKLQKGTSILQHAPVDDMNHEERIAHKNVFDRAKAIHASMAGSCIELKMLSKRESAFAPERIEENKKDKKSKKKTKK